MSIRAFIICTGLLIFTWSYCQSQKIERLKFFTDSSSLTGYLYLPKTDKACQVAIVIHAANEPLHSAALYQHIKDVLLALNSAVFIYDRRGSGESGGLPDDNNFNEQARDVISAIKLLGGRKDIDSKRISLIGISQGAWVAPISFSLDPSSIERLVLISMSGVSPSFQMKYGSAEALKQGNFNDSIVLKAIYLRNINDDFYRGQLDKTIAQNIIDSFREEKWFPLLFLPHRGYLPDTVTKSNWYKTMDFDPAVYLDKVSIPTLFLYGSYDQWVPIDSSISVIKNNMLQAHNNQYKIYRLKKGGHLMTIDLFNMSDTNFSVEFDQELKKWYAQKASD